MEKYSETLKSIVKTIPDVIYRLDNQATITFISDAVRKYGYSPEELIGSKIFELVHPEDREKVRLLTKRYNSFPFEGKHRAAEDESIFLVAAEGLYASESSEAKTFIGTQGIAREITERKHAEKRFRQQTEFLRLVLDSLPHPFYVINAFDYTVLMANSVAHEGPLSQGTTCYGLTHKSDRPCGGQGHPCPVDIIRDTKQPVTVEHVHHDEDGNPKNVEVYAYPVFDSEGNVSRIIEFCLDITNRKNMEAEREKLINELQKALGDVKRLSGFLPICSSCKKIRDDEGYWNQIEAYIRDHSEAEFSHSICPDCAKKLYPELDLKDRE
jgi:PAS domain S-box-containing protein